MDNSEWDALVEAIAMGIGFASIGGIAKAAQQAMAGKKLLRNLLLGMLISGCVGIMVSLLVYDSSLAVTTQGFLIATTGSMGAQILGLLVDVATSLIKRRAGGSEGPKE